MIAWRDPLSLVALVLVPALALFFAWAARRRARDLARFVAASLLPAIAPDLDPRRRTRRAVAIVAAVFCLALALAGPLWGFRWEEVRREGIDLVVAIDTSRSMLSNDVKPSRLARAKLAVQDLLATLHGDRVALVAFAGSAFVQCPLTLDYGAVVQSLDAFDVGLIPRGGTALAAAIETSLTAFEGREGKHQALVLITDGEDHEGKVDEATRHATERGVKIYTVGVGTGEGELIPGESGGFLKDRGGQVVKSRLDEETLKKIAADTGGVYLHATGAAFDLGALYRDYLGALDKRELASTLERRFEQRFQIPLALAFVLLLLEPLIGNRRRPERRRVWRWRRAARRTTERAPAAGTRGFAPAAHRDAGAKVVASALVVAALGLGWLDPHQGAREANRLYDAGKYDDAVAAYNQALIDHPGSPLLHFNLGDAAYKGGKYEAAASAFQQVPAGDEDPTRSARSAYNLGNAKYRLGAAAEDADGKRALTLYAEALTAYRRALGAAPDDQDAKYNYEFVAQKLEALRKKLEEQQKQEPQQDQPKQDQQQQQQQDQQQAQQDQHQQDQGGQQPQQEDREKDATAPQPSPSGDQEAADDTQKEQRQAATQPTAAPSPADHGAASAEGAKQPGEGQPPETATADETAAKDGEMSRQEATALLDAQRDQEVQPEDIVRRLQGAVVAEPAEDW